MQSGDLIEFPGGPWYFTVRNNPAGISRTVQPGERGVLGLERQQGVWEVLFPDGNEIWSSSQYFHVIPSIKLDWVSDAVTGNKLQNPNVTSTKFCDCSVHQLFHGGCKCGGK